MTWVGIADKTDFAKVTLPAIVKDFDFQFSFDSSFEKRWLKSVCFGELT